MIKLKTLAVVVCIIGIASSVIGGLFLLEYDTLTGLLIAFWGVFFLGYQPSLFMALVN